MHIVIVSPALADANNGNWRTAQRWRRFLAPLGSVRIVAEWPDAAAGGDDVMLALHARRSAAVIAAWHRQHGSRGLGVVLTGTDLHRDILTSEEARRSLAYARAIVVLHERGIAALPADCRGKTRIILQSATTRQSLCKTGRHLQAVAVGHLRPEKSPETIFALAPLLRAQPAIRLTHVGRALEPALAGQAAACAAAWPAYRWLGEKPHDAVRRLIQRAHLLVHPSRMEGGANVVIEAITSGTPVLASAVDGNIGLLGEDYPGYFPWGDAAGLAGLLGRLRRDQCSGGGLLADLRAACAERARLFDPRHEQGAIRRLLGELIQP